MARYRERLGDISPGGEHWKKFAGSWVLNGTQPQLRNKEHMTDTVSIGGPPYTQDHDLTYGEVRFNQVYRVNADGPVRRLVNYYTIAGGNTVITPSTAVGVNALITQVLARLNPSRPIVDLPLAIYELRELPRMLKNIGDAVKNGKSYKVRDLAGNYVEYSFGWAPLIGDLYKLWNIVPEMQEAYRRLKKLEETQKFSGSLKASFDTWPGPVDKVTQTIGYSFTCNTQFESDVRRWYSGKLDAAFTPPPLDMAPNAQLGRALGLNLSASTLWNAVPWTWLIDYFTSIGDFLDAHRGVLPYRVAVIDIMVREKIRERRSLIASQGYTTIGIAGQGKLSTWKQRFVRPYPTPTLFALKDDPLAGKAFLLGALFVSRFRR